MAQIFISHSHSDQVIADKLVEFILCALDIDEEDVLCTSVPGHELIFGTSVEQQLRQYLNQTIGLIALITQDSLRSDWVLFELGSSWAMSKLVIPIMGPGINYEHLPGPLKQYPGVRIEDENPAYKLTAMINQLAKSIKINEKNTPKKDLKKDAFLRELREWKSTRATPDINPQKQLEELTAQLEQLAQEKLSLQEEIQKRQQEYLGIVEQLEQSQKDYENRLQELEQEREQEKLELENSHQSALEALQNQLNILQQNLTENERKKLSLQEEIQKQQQGYLGIVEQLEQSQKDYENRLQELEKEREQERLELENSHQSALEALQNQLNILQQKLAEKEAIITQLQTPKKIEKPIELKSEKGIDYTKLEELLRQQKWKEADYETYVCMITAVGRKEGDYFEDEDIENFPCEDLRTIDQLWVQYSQGRFGFSVQKKIWLEVGGKVDVETERKLGDRVGWRKGGEWMSYDSLQFDLSAPPGHLPVVAFVVRGLVGVGGGRGYSLLAQRLVTCSL